jgi:hypothetical protein
MNEVWRGVAGLVIIGVLSGLILQPYQSAYTFVKHIRKKLLRSFAKSKTLLTVRSVGEALLRSQSDIATRRRGSEFASLGLPHFHALSTQQKTEDSAFEFFRFLLYSALVVEA